ncbi:MAG: hypothetical protein FJX31_00320 [Alphaproteobacteria bacterium]|nr:hypothetical protein [Alphaproteobacteria bacterium]
MRRAHRWTEPWHLDLAGLVDARQAGPADQRPDRVHEMLLEGRTGLWQVRRNEAPVYQDRLAVDHANAIRGRHDEGGPQPRAERYFADQIDDRVEAPPEVGDRFSAFLRWDLAKRQALAFDGRVPGRALVPGGRRRPEHRFGQKGGAAKHLSLDGVPEALVAGRNCNALHEHG